MFNRKSRYYSTGTLTFTTTRSDGSEREITYLERRFIGSSDDEQTLVEHTVTQGERLDVITTRYLGDPLLFWRLCDANEVFEPAELTDEKGETILITMPKMTE